MPSKRNAKSPSKARVISARLSDATDYREIETFLLLEPLNPARQTFDEDKLNRLIESIKLVGILEPLCVEPEGDMYRVHAGHRRLIAGRALELSTLPCRIFQPGTFSGDAIKHHENAMREDLNAAEEARHFKALLEQFCGGDVDRLCNEVMERREYVEERLLLIMGDERVFEALSSGVISIGVARELNKIQDPARRMMYLDCAARGGATVRMVKEWRTQGNMMDALVPNPPIPDNSEYAFKPADPIETGFRCYLCESKDNAHEMELLYVHRSCARAFQRLTERQARNEAAESTEGR